MKRVLEEVSVVMLFKHHFFYPVEGKGSGFEILANLRMNHADKKYCFKGMTIGRFFFILVNGGHKDEDLDE